MAGSGFWVFGTFGFVEFDKCVPGSAVFALALPFCVIFSAVAADKFDLFLFGHKFQVNSSLKFSTEQDYAEAARNSVANLWSPNRACLTLLE